VDLHGSADDGIRQLFVENLSHEFASSLALPRMPRIISLLFFLIRVNS